MIKLHDWTYNQLHLNVDLTRLIFTGCVHFRFNKNVKEKYSTTIWFLPRCPSHFPSFFSILFSRSSIYPLSTSLLPSLSFPLLLPLFLPFSLPLLIPLLNGPFSFIPSSFSSSEFASGPPVTALWTLTFQFSTMAQVIEDLGLVNVHLIGKDLEKKIMTIITGEYKIYVQYQCDVSDNSLTIKKLASFNFQGLTKEKLLVKFLTIIRLMVNNPLSLIKTTKLFRAIEIDSQPLIYFEYRGEGKDGFFHALDPVPFQNEGCRR